MSAGLKDFYEVLREAEKRRCKEDLFYLSKFVLGKGFQEMGMDRMDWHHKELCDQLMDQWRNRKKKPTKTTMKVEWPRGTLKSTICSVYFPVWVLLNEPDTRILIENETATNALRLLAMIKSCFEGKHLIYLFGRLYNPRHRWNLEELTVKRSQEFKEPSVDVGGVEVEKTGQHYDLYIGDDLQGKENSQTRDQIDKVVKHYKAAYSLMNPNGMLLFPMTRWAHGDLGGYMDELNEEDDKALRPRGIVVNRYTCWKDGKVGVPEFPTLLPIEELADVRAKQGPYLFACNYLLNPTSDENAVFKSDWIKYHDYTQGQLEDMGCSFFVAVDPAGDGEHDKADFTAIVVVAITPKYDILVCEVVREHLTRKQMADYIFNLAEQYKVRKVGMEAVLKFREMFTWLKMEAKLNGKRFPIDDFKNSNKMKLSRIRELQPVVEAGKCRWKKEHVHLDDEVRRFPKGKHDDCIDALAYTLEFLSVPPTRQPREFWENPNWLKDWDRDEPPPTPSDVKFWEWEKRRNRTFGKGRTMFSRVL